MMSKPTKCSVHPLWKNILIIIPDPSLQVLHSSSVAPHFSCVVLPIVYIVAMTSVKRLRSPCCHILFEDDIPNHPISRSGLQLVLRVLSHWLLKSVSFALSLGIIKYIFVFGFWGLSPLKSVSIFGSALALSSISQVVSHQSYLVFLLYGQYHSIYGWQTC